MNPETLSDDALLDRLKTLVHQEREDTAAVVEHLAEIDRRDLVQDRGYPSLYDYCMKVLGYSEHSAYHRIRAARAIKKKPDLLKLLRAGELNLGAIVLLHPHLDDDDADQLVEEARGKSKRDVEAFLAPLSPQPQQRDKIRIISVRSEPTDDMPLFDWASPKNPPAVETQLQSLLTFSAGQEFLELLERAKSLLWHRFPEGRMEDVFTAALRALLEQKDPGLWAEPREQTTSSGRKIPKWIRRQVWRRDGGKCVYQAADGILCGNRTRLEFDHVEPWSRGGSSNDPANIRLLCRAHNQFVAKFAGLDRPYSSPRLEPRPPNC